VGTPEKASKTIAVACSFLYSRKLLSSEQASIALFPFRENDGSRRFLCFGGMRTMNIHNQLSIFELS
jgi:hypothetical protein